MNSIRKYWAIFQITLINSLAYPGELIGRSLMIVPFMWIFYQLWKVTFAAAGTNTINGMTFYGTMWYLMMAETIELSKPRLANTISDNVKDGSIAYILNKPYNFLLYQFSKSMGETVFRAVMNAFFGGIVIWWLVGPPPAPLGWVFAILALFGTWIMNFCITCLNGLSAFLVEEISPFMWIYQKFVFILGGFLIPLDFYPNWLQSIAKALPFAYMVYGPSKFATTLAVLLLAFRSLLVPLKAVALNLLAVSGAFGALVLVFQDGHGARLLGLDHPLDGVFPIVPALVFCVVFGLSMDYEVFLVARVAEARRAGLSEDEALAEGLARTGPVITSAAAIMIAVFASFMLGEFVLLKMLGFALAVAVLLDATVIRMAIGPALLRLAGRWNWWPGR